jgi:hypothetical protein
VIELHVLLEGRRSDGTGTTEGTLLWQSRLMGARSALRILGYGCNALREDGFLTSGAKARTDKKASIAALEALRHPNSRAFLSHPKQEFFCGTENGSADFRGESAGLSQSWKRCASRKQNLAPSEIRVLLLRAKSVSASATKCAKPCNWVELPRPCKERKSGAPSCVATDPQCTSKGGSGRLQSKTFMGEGAIRLRSGRVRATQKSHTKTKDESGKNLLGRWRGAHPSHF